MQILRKKNSSGSLLWGFIAICFTSATCILLKAGNVFQTVKMKKTITF